MSCYVADGTGRQDCGPRTCRLHPSLARAGQHGSNWPMKTQTTTQMRLCAAHLNKIIVYELEPISQNDRTNFDSSVSLQQISKINKYVIMNHDNCILFIIETRSRRMTVRSLLITDL